MLDFRINSQPLLRDTVENRKYCCLKFEVWYLQYTNMCTDHCVIMLHGRSVGLLKLGN
jgi:hypothetical protein